MASRIPIGSPAGDTKRVRCVWDQVSGWIYPGNEKTLGRSGEQERGHRRPAECKVSERSVLVVVYTGGLPYRCLSMSKPSVHDCTRGQAQRKTRGSITGTQYQKSSTRKEGRVNSTTLSRSELPPGVNNIPRRSGLSEYCSLQPSPRLSLPARLPPESSAAVDQIQCGQDGGPSAQPAFVGSQLPAAGPGTTQEDSAPGVAPESPHAGPLPQRRAGGSGAEGGRARSLLRFPGQTSLPDQWMMSSSDDFDLVIEAMLEAPYQKKPPISGRHSERSSRSGSRECRRSRDRSGSRECRRSRDRSGSQLRSHSSGSTERARYSSQHRSRRRRKRSGSRRRGRTRGRRTRHRDHRGRHRRERARHRHHASHSRSPRFSRSRSPRYRSRSISRDRVYGRTLEERDACTILCLQLSGQIRPGDLERFFSSVGKVRDVKIISDRSSRRSKGIAYVEFYSVDSVPQAISLSGTKLLGVPIIIQASQAEKNRPDPGVGHPQIAGDGPLRLYVGSLHANITQDMLRAIFTPFGKIDSLHLIKDPQTGISKGYGFVTFADSECARRALQQLQGFELAGKPLRLSPVTDRWEPDPAASVLDTEDTERPGISLGPSSRLQLMARLAKGSGLEIPPATQAALQLQNIYPFGILMPTAAGPTLTQSLPGTTPG
ncbi:probable RNA-binding protein 23 [Mobula hypostoma]|uniref:probable RNA-binding protein 23 n=1 Tax=Mobula hypostoma TaxID=723540 RepID=UPI002FC36CCC